MASTIKKVILATSIVIASFNAHAINRIEFDDYGYINGSWGITQKTVLNNYVVLDQGPFNTVYVSRYTPDYTQISFIDFSTHFSEAPLTLGIYENAQRFASPGHPGLDLVRDGSGFNILNGRFEIFDIQKSSNGSFLSFAASFEIFDSAPLGQPALVGRVWYNSNYGIAIVAEPENLTMLMAGLGLLGIAVRRNNQA
ncbi:MAG TPA: PEP-CTERM sorting domain-containing protein [Methylophilus sp.]|uniref:PEP-CTERM sorting domain-containing protein n=1 Tax=Methylophilus sp. TaxID=29541 RepID=UPI002D1A2367|nr:PEP-CTERM sorting domain-containing protein [Methylophilus sp.]HSH87220.1 PEP-CTERM sorting domain-containing protein [Methylophilus sp.]